MTDASEFGIDALRRYGGTDTDILELYRAHWSTYVKLATFLLHGRTAAEDVTQDAFEATRRRVARGSDLQDVHAYVRRAVVNGCRSAHRRRRFMLGREPTDNEVWNLSSPADRVDDRIELLSYVSRLPRRQREVVVLRYWLDLSEKQIAATLNVSTGTVKTTASRALSSLRAAIGDHR